MKNKQGPIRPRNKVVSKVEAVLAPSILKAHSSSQMADIFGKQCDRAVKIRKQLSLITDAKVKAVFLLRFTFIQMDYFVCMCVCAPYACKCSWRPEDGIEIPGTGIAGCELSCGCWEPNPSPLWEQQELLTAEPWLQPPECHF